MQTPPNHRALLVLRCSKNARKKKIDFDMTTLCIIYPKFLPWMSCKAKQNVTFSQSICSTHYPFKWAGVSFSFFFLSNYQQHFYIQYVVLEYWASWDLAAKTNGVSCDRMHIKYGNTSTYTDFWLVILPPSSAENRLSMQANMEMRQKWSACLFRVAENDSSFLFFFFYK